MHLFTIIWLILFCWVIGTNLAQYVENERSPVVTAHAVIVDMRRRTHRNHSGHHHHHYHVTFEQESGERLELRVKRHEYYELAVGDRGLLTHQGTRYKGFER